MTSAMNDTLTVPLPPATAESLRKAAADNGQSVEDYARLVLEDAAAAAATDGDDAELAARIEAWRADRLSVPSADVHAWLASLDSDSPLPMPKARRPE